MPKKILPEIQELLNNKDWLVDMHINQLFSIVELSKHLKVTPATIAKALRKFNIQTPPQQSLREASNMRKYGVANPGALPEVRQKALNTMGVHNWSTGKRGKRDTTCLERYGDVNVGRTEYAKQKAKETNLKKYKRTHKNQGHLSDQNFSLLQNRDWLYEQHIGKYKTISEIARDLNVGWDSVLTSLYQQHIHPQSYTHKIPASIITLLKDKTWLEFQNKNLKKSATEIASELNIDPWTVQRHFKENGLVIQLHPSSIGEKQISEFLLSFNIQIQQNTRTIIPPQELDIYLPDYKLAIEYCGIYWHGEQFKSRRYHRNKMMACNKLGIRLLTIYETEWIHQQDLVKQKILSILKLNNRESIYARNCDIVKLTKKQKKQFFDQYHIQQDGPGSISYGLCHNGKLVSAITFVQNKGKIFILNRYATSCNVPGGFTRLLSHFKKEHDWLRIITFADLRWSEGNLYQNSGFVLDKRLDPDYQYIIKNQPVHKFNFRRKFLPSKLKQFNPLLSEWENCKMNSIDRIWDCGKLRFIINK